MISGVLEIVERIRTNGATRKQTCCKCIMEMYTIAPICILIRVLFNKLIRIKPLPHEAFSSNATQRDRMVACCWFSVA